MVPEGRAVVANLIGNRIGVSVWLHSLKHVNPLRRFGNIIYVSKKMKYVILYCDQDQLEKTLETLHSLHYVKAVEPSLKPFLRTDFEKINDKRDNGYDIK